MPLSVEQIATLCHETNRHYCELIGDNSQMQWHATPSWQKESAISGVEFHQLHPDAQPCDSHDNWLKHKEAEGWVYGPAKNPDIKQHPCMVAYDELPEAQRVKDALFIAVVHACGQD